jgi:hypothetical protein
MTDRDADAYHRLSEPQLEWGREVLIRGLADALHRVGREDAMRRQTLGFIASLAGAALGVWYWRRRYGGVEYGGREGIRSDSTPAGAAEGVI